MNYGKQFNTDNLGLDRALSTKAGYASTYGGTLSTFFKAFTTSVSGNGVPHYREPLRGTGLAAIPSGLNPLGTYTLNENILHGSTMPSNIDLDDIDAKNARLHGLKTPMTMVGVGYDTWGFPSPNFNSTWDVSGILGSQVPSSNFAGTGTTAVAHLRDVPTPLWKAGPLDLRWDQERAIWTSPIGVFPARITRTVADSQVNPSTGFFWAGTVKYDAQIVDGLANPLTIANISHIGPAPSGSYKIKPYSSGDFCFMVRYVSGNVPRYGLWLMELPGTDECASDAGLLSMLSSIPTYSGAVGGDPFTSTDYLTGSGLANGFATFPMSLEYGGLGINTVEQYQIPIGTTGNTFETKQILGVSGISVSYNATGIVLTMSDVSGVWATAGNNLNITSLSGLTTPLSIQQGGTNSTTRVWVATTGNETVSGIKTFVSQVRFGEGTRTQLAVAYNKLATIGLFVDPSGQGLMSTYLGTGYFSVNATGARSWGRLIAKNDVDAVNPAVIIKPTVGSTAYPFVVEDVNGTGNLYLGATGIQFGPVGNSTTILVATGVNGNHVSHLPSGGDIPNTVFVYSHLVGPESLSGIADGSNLTFYTRYSVYNTGVLMVFRNGLLQGQGAGEDFVLSNLTGIIFNTGFGPASGDILKAVYQRIL